VSARAGNCGHLEEPPEKGKEMIWKRGLILIALLALTALPASADQITFTFTSDHCTGGCLPAGATNMGTITVTDAGVGVVDVSVLLSPGFGFVSTGAGAGASFFFRLNPNPTITYSNLTAGWSIPNVIGVNQQAPGFYAGDGLAGQFEYALACNPPGSPLGCGNGGSSPKPSPLNFTVTGAGISAASFDDPGSSGSPFAADVISTTGNTGLIDASRGGSGGGGQTVPEPASLLLLGSGLIVTARRRFRRQ
jgi:PEP-CTERM motif-containing protein